jgi:hypothetical protein
MKRFGSQLAKSKIGSMLCAILLVPVSVAQNSESSLSPPVNHESGKIERVLTAEDQGYRFRGYVVRWRDARIFVTALPNDMQGIGGSADFIVYRTATEGRRLLRFAQSIAPDEALHTAPNNEVPAASITLGRAKIEEILRAQNEGFHFLAYQISWHDTQVMLVDPAGDSAHAIGEYINFKVLRTAEPERRLSFLMDENAH